MEDSPELERVTHRFYQALVRGDAGSVHDLTASANGVLGIGSDPGEWWEGAASITEHVKAQFDALGGGLDIVHSAPKAYQEGSVGWISDRSPAFRRSDGTEVAFRFTAVFHKEKGEWKIVQFHTSIGVPNESAVGQALPT